MKKIKLLSNTEKDAKNLVQIYLETGSPKKPFDKDSKFLPKEGGYTIFVDPSEFKWYQKAARTIASLKVFSLNLQGSVALTKEQFYWFLIALYDGQHELKVASVFDKETCKKLENTVNTVNQFRAIADSDSKESTPSKLVEKLFSLIKDACDTTGNHAKLNLIKRGDEKFKKFTGLNAVGFASTQDPCMGIIDVVPKALSKDAPIDMALVGKGITFDTGGYSLKPDKYMETMRTDKTAVVYLAGAVTLAILQGLKKRVRLYLCCSENMVSGQGMLPGDVLTYPNGVTVEINNTDAEGRLVLADGLLQACKDKPQFILDMATLTGAAKIAVGRDMFSVIAQNQEHSKALCEAFDANDEMYWQLPLCAFHKRFLSSRRADMTNSGHGDGAPGASVAASFLSSFVEKDIPWVHIDLSSAYLPDGSPFLAAGPTGSTILGLSYYLTK